MKQFWLLVGSERKQHAFDLWNSHTYLVATPAEKSKYQELISGTFHEVEGQIRFIDVTLVKELLEKKQSYLEMEQALGILRK